MKKTLLISTIFLFFATAKAQVQSQGFNAPDTAETMPSSMCLSCPGSSWYPEANVALEDTNYATGYMSKAGFCWQSSCYFTRALVARDFGFSIPANASITGIEVKVNRMADTANAVTDTVVQLILNSNLIGQNKYNQSFWPATLATQFYGDSANLWGLTSLTAADVNDADFGVYIKTQNHDTDYYKQAKIDFVAMKVYYTSSPNTIKEHAHTFAAVNASVSPDSKELVINTFTTIAKLDIELYSILGNKVIATTSHSDKNIHKVSLPVLTSGMYLVKIGNTQGEVVKKVWLY